MRVTEPGASEPVHHEVDEVVRQELVHAFCSGWSATYYSSSMTLMVEMMISMMRIMATASSASRAGPCLPCVQLGELSQLNYGGDDGDGEDDDIDGEVDNICTRRVEPVWRADRCPVVGLLLILI